MSVVIKVAPGVGEFAEDKDLARQLRADALLPALARGEDVVLDFAGVTYATQSFVHTLIGEALHRYGEAALSKMEFRHCSAPLRSLIELVVDYSLNGFAEVHSS